MMPNTDTHSQQQSQVQYLPGLQTVWWEGEAERANQMPEQSQKLKCVYVCVCACDLVSMGACVSVFSGRPPFLRERVRVRLQTGT